MHGGGREASNGSEAVGGGDIDNGSEGGDNVKGGGVDEGSDNGEGDEGGEGVVRWRRGGEVVKGWCGGEGG